MQSFVDLVERAGVLFALPAVALGFVLGGPKTALLGGLVGFFLGMSLRSVVRTFTVGAAIQ